MKNIIKKQINYSSNTQLFLSSHTFCIVGPRGNASFDTRFLSQTTSLIKLKKKFICTFFRLFSNMTAGVVLGFTTRVVLIGVGFRIEAFENHSVKLKIGLSKLIFFNFPKTIQFLITKKKTSLVLHSIDGQVLLQTCRKLSDLKFPDVYRGKGIRYKNQFLVVKQVKKKK
jgi:large subunit ribosomal protein L6